MCQGVWNGDRIDIKAVHLLKQCRHVLRVHLLFRGICEHFEAQDGPCKNSQHLDMSENPNITEVSATGIFRKQLQDFVWLPSSYWD